jgi:hypothetical protein
MWVHRISRAVVMDHLIVVHRPLLPPHRIYTLDDLFREKASRSSPLAWNRSNQEDARSDVLARFIACGDPHRGMSVALDISPLPHDRGHAMKDVFRLLQDVRGMLVHGRGESFMSITVTPLFSGSRQSRAVLAKRVEAFEQVLEAGGTPPEAAAVYGSESAELAHSA